MSKLSNIGLGIGVVAAILGSLVVFALLMMAFWAPVILIVWLILKHLS